MAVLTRKGFREAVFDWILGVVIYQLLGWRGVAGVVVGVIWAWVVE